MASALLALTACPRPASTGAFAVVPDSVSVGYGPVARGQSIAADGDERNAGHAVGAEEMIAGRIHGVGVGPAPNREQTIRIRGISAVLVRSEPLGVVGGTTATSDGRRSALARVMPNDVPRIEGLKDAASLASDGPRGTHGVILVTTRHGS